MTTLSTTKNAESVSKQLKNAIITLTAFSLIGLALLAIAI